MKRKRFDQSILTGNMNTNPSRRKWLKQVATGTIAATALGPFNSFATEENMRTSGKLKGNINHSVCQWTYNFRPLDDLCVAVKKMGLKAIDLIAPKDWP